MDFEWINARDTEIVLLSDEDEDEWADEEVPEGEYRVYLKTLDNGVGIDGTSAELKELAYALLSAVNRYTV